jgi:hypothetical protein
MEREGGSARVRLAFSELVAMFGTKSAREDITLERLRRQEQFIVMRMTVATNRPQGRPRRVKYNKYL